MTSLHPVERISEVRHQLADWRSHGSIGLVPTMGALHAGHARLIQQARAECAHVAVSVFVNPLQFDRQDDLERYPRTLDADLAVCEQLGADLVFSPQVSDLYPIPQACTVDPGPLATHLCGAHRPGHFRGVATVVLKLLNIVSPDRAYFGEKDAQQLAIIRRMAADFDLPVTIVGVPTVREDDGLALSSRNVRLSVKERRLAPSLHAALMAAAELVAAGTNDVASITATALAKIPSDPALRIEYFDLVDPSHLQPLTTITDGPVLIAGALWVGNTRLIDNLRAEPPAVA
jgi:pantoate--beta-alanine ligase